jgi:restriction system protein
VQETGPGADGGIDLVLHRDGLRTLVQCKQWKAQRVGAPVVREQFGLLTHHGAVEAVIVTCGSFTPEAQAFARGKPIRLVDGPQLAELVRGVQKQPLQSTQAPAAALDTAAPPGASRSDSESACPRCGSAMVRRTARATRTQFLGCSRFPRCRGVRQLSTAKLANTEHADP